MLSASYRYLVTMSEKEDGNAVSSLGECNAIKVSFRGNEIVELLLMFAAEV